MAAIANLVAYDSTPSIHTFIPISVTREKGKVVALWREQINGVPVEASGVVTLAQEQLPSGVYKVDLTVAIPVMEAVGAQNAAGYTAAPKVAHTPRVVVTGYFSSRAVPLDRQRVRQLAMNILNGNTATAVANTTGPSPDSFDWLVLPT